MPTTLCILCVDDEPDVLEAIESELSPLEDMFPLYTADCADNARQRIREIHSDSDRQLALILCDHIMPGQDGAQLLVELHQHPETHPTRKVLLTGQAGLQATIKALNQAHLDYYLAKPWNTQELTGLCKKLLTEYILEQGLNPLPMASSLDSELLQQHIHRKGLISDT